MWRSKVFLMLWSWREFWRFLNRHQVRAVLSLSLVSQLEELEIKLVPWIALKIQIAYSGTLNLIKMLSRQISCSIQTISIKVLKMALTLIFSTAIGPAKIKALSTTLINRQPQTLISSTWQPSIKIRKSLILSISGSKNNRTKILHQLPQKNSSGKVMKSHKKKRRRFRSHHCQLLQRRK